MIDERDRNAIVRRYCARYSEFGRDVRTLNAGIEHDYCLQHAVYASAVCLRHDSLPIHRTLFLYWSPAGA